MISLLLVYTTKMPKQQKHGEEDVAQDWSFRSGFKYHAWLEKF